METRGPIPGNGEYKKSIKLADGKCLNVLVKNHNGEEKQVMSHQGVESWSREWAGCLHGGERQYDDKLEYV